MNCRPARLGKTMKHMGNHLCAQIPDLLAGEGQFDDGVGTVGQVNDAEAEGFVEGDVGGSVASEADGGAEGGFEGGAEGDGDVFGGVVVVDWEEVSRSSMR